MSVSKKVKKERKVIIIIGLLILFLLILGGIRLVLNYSSVKIDSRVKEIKDFQSKEPDYKVNGWVKIPGTDIDYPVIEDFNKIIKDGKEIEYLFSVGDLDQLNRINYIMGHNVMNLSTNPLITEKGHVRFEQLMSFVYLDFAKENEYVQFSIDGKDYLFKIFAVSFPSAYGYNQYNEKDLDDSDVKAAVDQSLKNSIFKYDVDVDSTDTIITLYTCTRMFGFDREFEVDARLVREGESTRKYDVVKTKKYDEVEKQMKGGNRKNEDL